MTLYARIKAHPSGTPLHINMYTYVYYRVAPRVNACARTSKMQVVRFVHKIVYTHAHVHTRTHIHTRTHTHTHTHTHTN